MTEEPKQHRRGTGRKLAEWVTMGLSGLLVLTVAVCLVYQAVQEDSPFAPTEVRVLAELAHRTRGKFIVPVKVRNHGRRTLQDFKVRVRYRSPQGGEETGDFTIDFLGGGATQRVYLYFDRHPRELGVKAEPFEYRLE